MPPTFSTPAAFTALAQVFASTVDASAVSPPSMIFVYAAVSRSGLTEELLEPEAEGAGASPQPATATRPVTIIMAAAVVAAFLDNLVPKANIDIYPLLILPCPNAMEGNPISPTTSSDNLSM